MVGHDSHAPSPPREPQPTTPTGSGTLGLEETREDDEVCDNSRLGPDAVDMTPMDPLEGDPTGQEVFLVQGCSDQALICDHNTHECFFLKWKTLKKDQKIENWIHGTITLRRRRSSERQMPKSGNPS